MGIVSEHELPERVLAWVVNCVDRRAVVQSVHQLHGGTSSLVYNISLWIDEKVKDVVLRQIDNVEWLHEEPELVLHEVESLRRAFRTGVPTPEIIAYDDTGRACGVPTVLMTKLEGSVDLRPRNKAHWLNGLAESLVRIHAAKAEGFPWTYFTYSDVTCLETPTWSNVPELWDIAIDIVKGPRPHVDPCFIHRDYHPTNVLWTGKIVSGVVDWVNACLGPAGVDVGHCRVNLAQLFDVPTADAFLSAYQKHAGSAFNYDPYWDLLSLIDILSEPPKVYPGWETFGVTGLTDELMVKRVDNYMMRLVQRFRSGE